MEIEVHGVLLSDFCAFREVVEYMAGLMWLTKVVLASSYCHRYQTCKNPTIRSIP